MRISDWSSDVCSSDLLFTGALAGTRGAERGRPRLVRPGRAESFKRCDAALPHLAAMHAGSLVYVFGHGQLIQATCAIVVNAHWQIGRASCRERVCPYVSISVVAVNLKKKKKETP